MKILWIHEFLPSPATSGSSLRMMQLLLGLRWQGHEITYISVFPDIHESGAELLSKAGILYYVGDTEMLAHFGIEREKRWDLCDLLQSESFDVAIATLWFWNYLTVPELYVNQIRKHSPQTSIVLMSDDRHGLRKEMEARLTGSRSLSEVAIDIERREREAFAGCDGVITIAEAEKQWILSNCPGTPVGIVPFHVEGVADSNPDYESRSGILILGDFSNEAMRDGYAWFLSSVWPSIKNRIANVMCSVAGNESQSLPGVADGRIRFLGRVGDLGVLFGAHRLFLAPVRFGTGVVTKNLLALAQGIPVITTSTGAQSLSLLHMKDAVVADDPEEIASHATQIYTDSERWRKFSEAGPECVRRSFTIELTYSALEKFMRELCTQPRHHRLSSVQWSNRLLQDIAPRSANFRPIRFRPAVRARSLLKLAEQLLHSQELGEAAVQFRCYLSQMECAKNAPQRGWHDSQIGSHDDLERGIERALRGLDQCSASSWPGKIPTYPTRTVGECAGVARHEAGNQTILQERNSKPS